jgi:hypothetical protein
VAGMVADATLLLDQRGYPPEGPETRLVPESFRASFQGLLNLSQILRCQTSPAAVPARCFQAAGTFALQSSGPSTHGLPMNANLPRYLGLPQTLLEQLSGSQTPSFQGFKVAPNSPWVSHGETVHEKYPIVTILGEIQ